MRVVIYASLDDLERLHAWSGGVSTVENRLVDIIHWALDADYDIESVTFQNRGS